MRTVKDPNDTANISADAHPETEESPPESGPVLTTPSAPSEVPTLAFRCDGKVLLSTADLSDIDLSKRELWVGLVLTEAEASDIHERLNFEEAAAPTTARILALAKKAKKTIKDEDDDE